MTTYVQARDAIVNYLNPAWVAAYSGIPIFYENTTQVDLDTVGNAFLFVEINFTDSLRQGVDLAPMSRSYGELTLRLFTKEGQGTRTTLAMQDALVTMVKYRTLSGVTLDCPTPGRKQSRDGWSSFDLNVPFNFWQ
jgi:hypothetical protein